MVQAPDLAQDAEAELRTDRLGSLTLHELGCGPARLDRRVPPGPQSGFLLLMVRQGNVSATHCGHHAVLAEGDLVLCEPASRLGLEFTGPARLVLLTLPHRLLRTALPSPERFCGRVLPASRGLAPALAALVASLATQLENDPSEELRTRLGRHVLELLGSSYALAFDAEPAPSAVVSGRSAQVRRYIEQHLRDASLSPGAIASALRLSSRYVRLVFASSGETVSTYILRRRLEECARQIADPQWRGHSISEIAFAWGFNSAPHFTRSFRERYGCSPRSWRREHLERQCAAPRVPAVRGFEAIAANF